MSTDSADSIPQKVNPATNLMWFFIISFFAVNLGFALSIMFGARIGLTSYAALQLLISIAYPAFAVPLDKAVVDPVYYCLGLLAVVLYFHSDAVDRNANLTTNAEFWVTGLDAVSIDSVAITVRRNCWPFVAIMMLGMKLGRHTNSRLRQLKPGFAAMFFPKTSK